MFILLKEIKEYDTVTETEAFVFETWGDAVSYLGWLWKQYYEKAKNDSNLKQDDCYCRCYEDDCYGQLTWYNGHNICLDIIEATPLCKDFFEH